VVATVGGFPDRTKPKELRNGVDHGGSMTPRPSGFAEFG
jgi:hypothetical protein